MKVSALNKKKGFTLIELMVVIAILAALASIGYGPILEENGVSLATYKNIKRTEALYTKYFQHLYDEGGVKAVDKETIKKTLNDNYQAV